MSPLREVVSYEQLERGAFIKLHCGHSKWVAGLTERPKVHPCHQSPCYRLDQAMGSGSSVYGGVR